MATLEQVEVNTNAVIKPELTTSGILAGDIPVIQVQDVHKSYDLGETKVHALRGVDMTIQPGEFVAIMGSSGSGKSTFMNMLGCLDKPTSGNYLLEGTNVSSLDKKQLAAIRNRKLGFVFQGFNLLSRTTALENVELPTLYAQMAKEQRQARAKEVLGLVGSGRQDGPFSFPAFWRATTARCHWAGAGKQAGNPAGRRTNGKSGQQNVSGDHANLPGTE